MRPSLPGGLSEEAAIQENGVIALAPPKSPRIGKKHSRIDLSLLYRRPTIIGTSLFLLILSGPPRFRIRDPEASLRGDIDWVVALHAVVWGLAGLWVLWQLGKRFQAGRPLFRLRLPQYLAFGMILVLAASTWVSDAPVLTAFKVYQILVSLLFTQIFTERFGLWTSLKAMLWGNALLCAAITFCAFLLPDEVWVPSDLNPGVSRLFGGQIAQTGVVAVLAMILLLTSIRRIRGLVPIALLFTFGGLVLFSLMRTAYITAFVFFALVLIKHPNTRPLRRFTYFLLLLALTLYSIGRLPSVSDYRDPASVSNLSDRVGLWQHLTGITLSRSPWLGLGYYAASRIHGPEYNPGLGTAHSIFVEVLSGGGVLSFGLLVALCTTLIFYAGSLLYIRGDRLSFATSTLFLACLLFAAMGEEIDSGPVAVGFWYAATALPIIYRSCKKKSLQTLGATSHATV